MKINRRNFEDVFSRARFLKINDQNFPNALRGSAILLDLTKINQRSFEDVSSGSAIFEDTNIIKKPKNSNCLARERNFLKKIFEDVPHGSAIFKNRGAIGLVTDLSTKSTLKARPPNF